MVLPIAQLPVLTCTVVTGTAMENDDFLIDTEVNCKLDGMLEWVCAGLAAADENQRFCIMKDMQPAFKQRLYDVALENEDYEVCATLLKIKENESLHLN